MRPIDADALLQRIENWDRQLRSFTHYTDRIALDVLCGVVDEIDDLDTIDYAPKQQWISVKDRLPEPDEDGTIPAVFVTDGEFIHMAYCSHNNWFFCENGEMKENMFYYVTYWMPLPEPPKEGEI